NLSSWLRISSGDGECETSAAEGLGFRRWCDVLARTLTVLAAPQTPHVVSPRVIVPASSSRRQIWFTCWRAATLLRRERHVSQHPPPTFSRALRILSAFVLCSDTPRAPHGHARRLPRGGSPPLRLRATGRRASGRPPR